MEIDLNRFSSHIIYREEIEDEDEAQEVTVEDLRALIVNDEPISLMV